MDHIIVETNRIADYYCIQSCTLKIRSYRSWKTVTFNEIYGPRSNTANGYGAETYPKILFLEGSICRDPIISIDQTFPTCALRSPKGSACTSQGLRGRSRKIK